MGKLPDYKTDPLCVQLGTPFGHPLCKTTFDLYIVEGPIGTCVALQILRVTQVPVDPLSDKLVASSPPHWSAAELYLRPRCEAWPVVCPNESAAQHISMHACVETTCIELLVRQCQQGLCGTWYTTQRQTETHPSDTISRSQKRMPKLLSHGIKTCLSPGQEEMPGSWPVYTKVVFSLQLTNHSFLYHQHDCPRPAAVHRHRHLARCY